MPDVREEGPLAAIVQPAIQLTRGALAARVTQAATRVNPYCASAIASTLSPSARAYLRPRRAYGKRLCSAFCFIVNYCLIETGIVRNLV